MKTTPFLALALAKLYVVLRALGTPVTAAVIERSLSPACEGVPVATLRDGHRACIELADMARKGAMNGHHGAMERSLLADAAANAIEWINVGLVAADAGASEASNLAARAALRLLAAKEAEAVVAAANTWEAASGKTAEKIGRLVEAVQAHRRAVIVDSGYRSFEVVMEIESRHLAGEGFLAVGEVARLVETTKCPIPFKAPDGKTTGEIVLLRREERTGQVCLIGVGFLTS